MKLLQAGSLKNKQKQTPKNARHSAMYSSRWCLKFAAFARAADKSAATVLRHNHRLLAAIDQNHWAVDSPVAVGNQAVADIQVVGSFRVFAVE